MANDTVANPDGNSIVDYKIDDLFSSSGIGSLDKAIGLNMYGINYQQAPAMVPRNKEQPGYVFFTRPQLNMQGDNIRNLRLLYNYLTNNAISQERAIRCLLDPRLGAGYKYVTSPNTKPVDAPIITSPIVDNENCFIPWLSNNIETLTGWPEQVMTFLTSKEDVFRGTHTQANGIVEINSKFTLSATFRNVYNNPILKMISVWLAYMGHVTTTGRLRPYPDFEAKDRKDYNTRIYRVLLDPQRERVTGIIACGAAVPSSNAISAFADYSRSAPISEVNKDFTISFECDGCIIFDPILEQSFNGVVQGFCPGMRDEYRASAMVKLDKIEINYFRGVAYPRINPSNSAFEIWVPRDVYAARLQDIGPLLNQDYVDGMDYDGSDGIGTNGPGIWV